MRSVDQRARWTFYLWWIAVVISLLLVGAVQSVSALSKDDMLHHINESRITAGIEPLETHTGLDSSAYAKAEHMLEMGYWDHYGPDDTTPWSFIESSGYEYIRAGENLGRGFSSVDSLVQAWLNSPAHRANQLSTSFTEVGIATKVGVMDDKPTTVVVVHFGLPKTPNRLSNQHVARNHTRVEVVRDESYIERLRGFWAVISRITVKTVVGTAI